MLRNNRKILTGVVKKISGEKTVKVLVVTTLRHPKYKKVYNTNKNFIVHDPLSQAKVGQKVTIMSIRPISKLKNWCILQNKVVECI